MANKNRGRTITRETLSKKISPWCNYMDPELVGIFYSGLLKMIVEDLRVRGYSHLPGWGMFKVSEIKARKIELIRSKEMVLLPATKKIKFEPCDTLKYYTKNKL